MAENNFDEENEMVSFGLIASAGQARSLAFEALNRAKEGDFEAANALMEQSRAAALEAHNVQTGLLTKEAQGDHTVVDVLLVHAQDHLMTSLLAQELIGELIELHKKTQA